MRLRPAAPVLARTATEAQVGIHRPVVLSGLSPAQMHFLGSLEGGRLVSAREERTHATVLAALDEGGMLAPRGAPAATVRFHNAGAIAVEAAVMLARLGWNVSFADAGAAHDRGGREPVAPGSSLGAHAAQRVRRAVAAASVRGAQAHADLDVLVTVGVPATRHRTLLAADAPHLLVCCDEHGATVGPVVIPGAGACAQCLGMHAADQDGLWPRIALQCEARRPRTDPLTAGMAGMLVARLAADFVAGVATSRWRVDGHGVEQLPVPAAHPGCRCGVA
ncbi:hypothetical protein [Demequina activiva]|nr:hypothetical protein [Demequina activiva]